MPLCAGMHMLDLHAIGRIGEREWLVQRVETAAPQVDGGGVAFSLLLLIASPAVALPSPDEVPEEVLRNQRVLQGRSAIDNRELSASEYAELQALLQESQRATPRVSPRLQRLIVLLKLRKLLKSLTPF